MKVTWEVEDGYCGGSRPQHLEIDDSEFEGMNEDEKKEHIEYSVQDAFEQEITWVIKDIEE